ncbi:MAG: histidinol dehydrogenase [Planctomycetota bacterium]|nr:MAG: histidinol dehydrogenase [Planctomycetota bacterium]
MPHQLDKILISYDQPDFKSRLDKSRLEIMKLARFAAADDRYQQVQSIRHKVAKEKDEALVYFTEKFDGVKLTPDQLKITKEQLQKAHKEVEKENKKLMSSVRQAIENVRKYQTEIFIGNKNIHPGIKYTPIKRVGICVPGASAPLPSTVIMTAVPAIVAGVKPEHIVVVSPPRYNDSIHPVTLAVCHELKIENVYRVGGAQAVAALAIGTATIPKVDKIVGPGNQWVQTEKREDFGLVGIDSIAGPSEVLIIANDKANPAWVAADMLSQTEHDPGSATVFTDSRKLAENVLQEITRQLEGLDRKEATAACLNQFSVIAVFKNMADAISAANEFAPEHLEIQCGNKSREIADKIENAGAIFIGDYSPVAVGDYWAGPSHTLPTGMTAKFSSALSANDFIKSISIIEYDKAKLAESAEDIIRLAEAEGLDAHAKSIKIRQQ